MKRLLSALAVGVTAVAIGLFALVQALRPPVVPVPERRPLVLHDVTLLEPGRPARPGHTLRIADGRIAAIEPAAGEPASADASDLAGLFVAPGLIDMHVHYPPVVAVGNAELWSLLLLAHGVTAVRETGSIDGGVFAVRDAIRGGAFPGPRIFACGAMMDGPRPSFPSNRVVATAAEARAAVADEAARGADCIKAYNLLSPDALDGLRAGAAEAGLPLIGHAPHAVPLEDAGLVDLQHGTGAVIVDRARVGRSDFRAEDWRTVDAARIDHVARVSRAQGIAHTPTLVNARMRRLLADPAAAEVAVSNDTGLRHLPRFWPAVWATIWGPPFDADDREGEATWEDFRARQVALAVGLHGEGVAVHTGTDTLMPFVAPGSSLHGELADFVRAGIAPEDAWRAATVGAGSALSNEGLGSLEVGAPADLLLLRSDPRADLAALAAPDAVVADGRLYRRPELDDALAAFDAHFHGAFYEAVMGAVVRAVQRRFAPAEPPHAPPPAE